MSRRIRTIKPETTTEDEAAAALSDAAWRLWVAARTFADDWGAFRAGERYLAATVWQDTARAKKIPGYLAELEAAKKIRRYTANGQPFALILCWDEEQRIDDRSKRTRLPSASEETREVSSDIAATSPESPRVSGSRGDLGKVAAHARPRASSPPEGDLDPDREGERKDPPARVHAREDSSVPDLVRHPQDRLAYAYARGIDAGAAMMIVPPSSPNELAKLVLACETHGRRAGIGDDPAAREQWIQAQAEAYARTADQRHRRRSFWIVGFVEWLGGGANAAKPGVQPAAPGARSWTDQNPDVKTFGKPAGAGGGPGDG